MKIIFYVIDRLKSIYYKKKIKKHKNINNDLIYDTKYSKRFMIDALEFLDTYRLIKAENKKLNIKNLLLCTSIELSLKSNLIKSKGTITKKELKKIYSHDLCKLVNEYIKLNPNVLGKDEVNIIKYINNFYKDKEFQYPVLYTVKDYIDFGVLEKIAEKLIDLKFE